MSVDPIKNGLPYTIIEPGEGRNGRSVDCYYLVFGGEKLSLSPTEYALAQTLVVGELNAEEAGEERQALRGDQAPISDSIKYKTLSKLRTKIDKKFSGELVLPPAVPYSKPRLLTKKQIEKIHSKLISPGKGIVSLLDEYGRRHLFIDGVRVVGFGKEIAVTERHYRLLLTIISLKRYSSARRRINELRAAFCEITGHRTLKDGMLANEISRLRIMLQPTGWTISALSGWRGNGNVDYCFVRTDSNPAATSETRRPNRRAAHPHLPQSPAVSRSLEHARHG